MTNITKEEKQSIIDILNEYKKLDNELDILKEDVKILSERELELATLKESLNDKERDIINDMKSKYGSTFTINIADLYV